MTEQERVTAFIRALNEASARYGVDIAAEVKRRRIKVDSGDGRGEQIHEESWIEMSYALSPDWRPDAAQLQTVPLADDQTANGQS